MREVSTQGRGRPKTLDRDQVLQEALMAYWSRGTKNVSISDICLATGASKPGVYREFGNDDGLKASALETYYILAVQPLINIFEKDQSMCEAIDASVDYMTQDRTELGIPQGCLFVNMRAQSQQLGPLTRETLNAFRRSLLSAFAAWAERSKARGECTNIPNDIAALYIDAQHGGAMRMQREGVPNETVANVLRMALCTLVVRSAQ
jgi:AcrR family transcriptional regulator